MKCARYLCFGFSAFHAQCETTLRYLNELCKFMRTLERGVLRLEVSQHPLSLSLLALN